MDMTRVRIRLTLDLSVMFCSFHKYIIGLSLAIAAVHLAIIDNISALDPASDMMAPRYDNSCCSVWQLQSIVFPSHPPVHCYPPSRHTLHWNNLSITSKPPYILVLITESPNDPSSEEHIYWSVNRFNVCLLDIMA